MSETEHQRQHEQAMERRARLNPSTPIVKVIKSEAHNLGVINGLRHINSVLREELGVMKDVIRQKDTTIIALKFQVEQWSGDSFDDLKSLRAIVEGILEGNYPDISLAVLRSDDRRVHVVKARQRCYYETYVQRPEMPMAIKAKFFKRDHSTYRYGVKKHATSIGITGMLLGERIS